MSDGRALVRVGGVPEHFNLPWAELDDTGLPVRVDWRHMPGGTGDLCAALVRDELDIALVLTEGVVRHIRGGSDVRIVGTYVASPLQWGVHVSRHALFETMDSLRGARFAVSRFGSGSHLMALLDARARGWREPAFVEVGDLQGGREALAASRADAFMWEQTMSLPFVRDLEWRRLSTFRCAWPAFLVAASPRALPDCASWLPALLAAVDVRCNALRVDVAATARRIHAAFGVPTADARAWIDSTTWACSTRVDAAALIAAAQAWSSDVTLPISPASLVGGPAILDGGMPRTVRPSQ